jgi:hypothetical protein
MSTKRKDIVMIEFFIIASIGSRMQRAGLCPPSTARERMKEEDAFYNEAGSSYPTRFVAWLTSPAGASAGRAKARPGEDRCAAQAACRARP